MISRANQGLSHLLLSRLFQAGLVAWLVGTLTFVLTRTLPGDMAYRIAAGRYGHDMVDGAAAEAVRAELALDQPGLSAYAGWLWDLLQLDLGRSLVSGRPVIQENVVGAKKWMVDPVRIDGYALGLQTVRGRLIETVGRGEVPIKAFMEDLRAHFDSCREGKCQGALARIRRVDASGAQLEWCCPGVMHACYGGLQPNSTLGAL